MQENSYVSLFEQIDQPLFEIHELPFEEEAAHVTHQLGWFAMQLARVYRIPRYDTISRENDAEHSFMVALTAMELAASYHSELDVGLVCQFAIVHELIEKRTKDVPTFTLDDAALAAKEAREHDALEATCAELPPYIAHMLRRYEAQVEPEARFVRLEDKMTPLISNLEGPGRKVMEEDYDIFTPEELDTNESRFSSKLRERFPDCELQFLHQVRDALAAKFSRQFAYGEA
jgi:putative hydrolase of HD superfamily